MRIDKFLKNSRIIKRRTVAKEACEKGWITVNGKIAKPGTEVKEGDIVKVTFGSSELEVRILRLLETVKKQDADTMYEVL